MIILDLEFDAMTITGDSHSQFHVLAVDDSMIDRKLIERLLKTSSYQGTKFTFLVKKGMIFMTRAVTVLFLCFVRFLSFFSRVLIVMPSVMSWQLLQLILVVKL